MVVLTQKLQHKTVLYDYNLTVSSPTKSNNMINPDSSSGLGHQLNNNGTNNEQPPLSWSEEQMMTSKLPASPMKQPNEPNSRTQKRSIDIGMKPLPQDFVPSSYSVPCGRGKGCYNSCGARRFRALATTLLQHYKQGNDAERTVIVDKLLNMMKEACPVGAFIKFHNGRYYELSEKAAKAKVRATIRDCVNARNRTKSTGQRAKSHKQTSDKASMKRDPNANQFPTLSDEETASSISGSFYDVDTKCSVSLEEIDNSVLEVLQKCK